MSSVSLTKRVRPLLLLSAAGALCLFVLTGCGGDDDPPADNGGNNSGNVDKPNNGGGKDTTGNNNGGGSIEYGDPLIVDKQTYKTVKIGSQTWMAQNLNVETGNSWCYGDDNSNCDTYGRLYDWETATTACPTGWKLPDTADWNRLVTSVGGLQAAGNKLKAANGWLNMSNIQGNGTDDYGFSALPGGIRPSNSTYDQNLGYRGYWWTSSARDCESCLPYYMREIGFNNGLLEQARMDGSNRLSVRCVK